MGENSKSESSKLEGGRILIAETRGGVGTDNFCENTRLPIIADMHFEIENHNSAEGGQTIG